MRFNGADAQDQTLAYCLIRKALRHEAKDFDLARTEALDRVVDPPPAHKKGYHVAVQSGSAVRDGPKCGYELLHIGDAIFEQITDSLFVRCKKSEGGPGF